VGQVGTIYEQLHLPGFDALRPKLQQYADSKAGFQKNRHQPLPQPLCDTIAKAWRRSFEEWGYAS
jgi:hypothetical protein